MIVGRADMLIIGSDILFVCIVCHAVC